MRAAQNKRRNKYDRRRAAATEAAVARPEGEILRPRRDPMNATEK